MSMEEKDYEELLAIAAKVLNPKTSDEDFGECIVELQNRIPHPEILRVLRDPECTSPEQLIKIAQRYKPIAMPAPTKNIVDD